MIAFGSDHGGLLLKDFLLNSLRSRAIAVEDCGTYGAESVDYPDYARVVARRVTAGEVERGVLICTSGIGMSIVANKFPGVRAALVHDVEDARLSRQHNDANVLVLSGGKTDRSLALQIIEIWLATPFSGGRHQRRLDKITQIERELGMEVNTARNK